jgi:hypothetical protein
MAPFPPQHAPHVFEAILKTVLRPDVLVHASSLRPLLLSPRTPPFDSLCFYVRSQSVRPLGAGAGAGEIFPDHGTNQGQEKDLQGPIGTGRQEGLQRSGSQ